MQPEITKYEDMSEKRTSPQNNAFSQTQKYQINDESKNLVQTQPDSRFRDPDNPGRVRLGSMNNEMSVAKSSSKQPEQDVPSFIDTFPSKVGGNTQIDDRPIRPRQNQNYGPGLDVIHEKVKSNKADQRHFLKKKSVYNPHESIKKAKEYKKKSKVETQIPKPKECKIVEDLTPKPLAMQKLKETQKPPMLGQLGKSKSEANNIDGGFSKFAEMDSKQRLQKITQLLRNK